MDATTSSAPTTPSGILNARREIQGPPSKILALLAENVYTSIPLKSGSAPGRRAVVTATVVSQEEADLKANSTSYAATNIALLLLEPSMPASILSGSCTQNIMTAYADYEGQVPFAAAINS